MRVDDSRDASDLRQHLLDDLTVLSWAPVFAQAGLPDAATTQYPHRVGAFS
jgi:hypothetical protein